MDHIKRFEVEWAGKPLIIETGRFAHAAGGSCTVQYGETIVLATATMSETQRDGLHFFPLMVDFEEKLYAAGRIKGSRFMKNEGRPTDEAVLVGRYIDRALRPLFDDSIRNDIQIIVTVLSFDKENDPDIVGLIAASCALHISAIPWNGPIGNIRVGQIDGEWVINPSYEARTKSILDLAFAGTSDKVIMVEAGANEAPDDLVVDAFAFGLKHMAKPIELIEKVRKEVGKEKIDPKASASDEEMMKRERQTVVEELSTPFILEKVNEYFFGQPKATKSERREAKRQIKNELVAFLTEKEIPSEELSFGTGIVEALVEKEVGRRIVDEDRRVDGRGIDEVRSLVSEVGLFERIHGSGHFMRGETQVLSMLTLGSPGDEQTLDGMETVGKKRFFHHYNFLPYSVGETKPMRGPGRREIGHGALAEKALLPMLPSKEDFPYTIRVVSEVLGSNGSSSMGSTCGATLALMDAGVPIKAPVAGLAIGIAHNEKGDWKVIMDLQDLEDGKGGMDFKITGTRDGVTAIQMDTKTDGLTMDIVKEAFDKGRVGRLQILDEMAKAIAEPRAELSEYAPRIITVKINPELIGLVIGPGGKMINEIIETTGVQGIDIEEDGLVMITSIGSEGSDQAKKWIEDLTREIKAGETFKGKVTRVMDFGAIVEFLPGKDGMVHVSELAPWRVNEVGDIVKMGDEVFIKVLEIDKVNNRTSLSMKQAEGNDYSKFKKPEPGSDSGARRSGPPNRDRKPSPRPGFKRTPRE